jgi:UDP-3-O-[3-hydroxymyristoyl] glucosamine N-acyltransferase
MSAPLGTLADIADRVGGRVIGNAALEIASVGAIDEIDERGLTFATDPRYLELALASQAAAVLLDESLAVTLADPGKSLVVVPATRLALATLLRALETPRPQGPFRAPSAQIDPSAEVAPDAWVGPQSVIGARARIGAGTVIGAGVIVGNDVQIGAECLLHARSVVADRCQLGDRVVLQSGAVIGSDGFGWAFRDGRLEKIPQIGFVRIGDDVEIGANTCIDRAQTGVTSIGNGTKIDNLCQIGHNCRIGSHTVIAGQTGMAGTTIIGDYVQVGGQSAFRGHITVGSRVTIAGASHVWNDVPDGVAISGQPAQNHRDNLKVQAYIRRLPKLYGRVEALERARENDHPRE